MNLTKIYKNFYKFDISNTFLETAVGEYMKYGLFLQERDF